MYRFLTVVIFSASFLFVSCENPLEDKVNKLEDELENQKIEQENQKKLIESLVLQLTKQQKIIDSLEISQKQYSDSLNSELKMLIESQARTIQFLINSQPETTDDYLRIDSLQICWGIGQANYQGNVVKFVVPFTEIPKVYMTPINAQGQIGVNKLTVSSASFSVSYESKVSFNYLAIGKWK